MVFFCSEKRLVLRREMSLKIIVQKKPPHRSVVTPIENLIDLHFIPIFGIHETKNVAKN